MRERAGPTGSALPAPNDGELLPASGSETPKFAADAQAARLNGGYRSVTSKNA